MNPKSFEYHGMFQKIKAAFLKFYHLFKNLYYFSKTKGRKNVDVYFDISKNDFDRYLYILMLNFNHLGLKVGFRFRFQFLASWSTDLISKSEIGYLLFSSPKNPKLSFSDYKSDDFDFFISNNYFSGKEGHYIPMLVVDTFYVFNFVPDRINVFNNRNIKIFFAGNFIESSYNRPELERCFGLPTRLKLYKKLIDNDGLRNIMVTSPSSFYDKYQLLIVDRKNGNIAPKLLIEYLQRSDFFIAFPGVVMPFCHNVIESMAYGCIPIINYPDLFDPPLIDGINCVSFSNETDFVSTIEYCLSMSQDTIQMLRQNVNNYYSMYLSPEAIYKNLVQVKSESQVNCFLNGEYNSVKLLL